MIKIYSVPDCKLCKKAKELLTKMNIEFEEYNLKKPENRDARKFYRNLGVKTAPIIVGVDKKGEEWILTEFNEESLLELLGV